MEAFCAAEKTYSESEVCRVAGVSRSGVYARKHRSPSARSIADKTLRVRVRESFYASRQTYGSPRICKHLQQQGIPIGKRRTLRLMHEELLCPSKTKRFVHTTDSLHTQPIAKNVLERNFAIGSINERWAGDITYIDTREGFLYLAVLLDVGSRKVVGFQMGNTLETSLALGAMKQAVALRNPPSYLVHHSDRGSQYASHEYTRYLQDQQFIVSMSRKGNCWDNAISESFFATLKKELIHRIKFESRSQAARAVADYINHFYNTTRLHSALGYQSPLAYERRLNSNQTHSAN